MTTRAAAPLVCLPSPAKYGCPVEVGGGQSLIGLPLAWKAVRCALLGGVFTMSPLLMWAWGGGAVCFPTSDPRPDKPALRHGPPHSPKFQLFPELRERAGAGGRTQQAPGGLTVCLRLRQLYINPQRGGNGGICAPTFAETLTLRRVTAVAGPPLQV